ncbi:MAG TPA: nicotinate-nucleotide--dimethylbenzimidazole phosphoribosyltransferase [Candidatus Egerieimonas intestinavium]|uniref:Nicotinate-nucleotide--dimethylbenzimidazole phosphoribosyltransferase n=1 Tax=Candidatus Egerieimonas intestinavium TaxID=2840777 RepID=A0A9D1JGZ8_9FIRM|nr:nicotinate-nucleotide--dimethylbenzimidazole phosphoribosyltransferase [Candidatus Egerieimonas intestinavium]
MNLQETIEAVKPLDREAMERTKKRWDSIAHPLHSLGKLEDALVQIAGITGSDRIDLSKRALVVMCADNGVVEEGVTQTGQEITLLVAENLKKGQAASSIMSQVAGAQVVPVDVGINSQSSIRNRKVAWGTKNMAKEPAMTREQAVEALEVGISTAQELCREGYRILATGEMGIGNTTTSSAVASVLLDRPVEEMTGRGAGLSTEGLKKKIAVIGQAIRLHNPQAEDPLDVLAKVGGFDLAGMAGVFLGGAALGIPVVIDGFISGVAALLAARLCPLAKDYMLASHLSKEPAARLVLDALGKEPFLTCDMSLGEGTGAVTLYPLLDMACAIYSRLGSFDDVEMEAYVPLD